MKRTNKQSGFTLTELMVLLVVIGVLSMLALPSFVRTMANSDLRSARENYLTAFRYAKIVSRTTGSPVSVTITTGASDNTITFTMPDGSSTLPDGTTMNGIALPSNITVASINAVYIFSPRGVISNQSNITLTSTRDGSLTSTITIVNVLGHITAS